jgi:uncharacterized membrane protein YjjB (DUF3815 family)
VNPAEIIYAFVGTLSFAFLFNIRGIQLFLSALGGAISWAVFSYGLIHNSSTVFMTFASAAAVSIYADVLSRILNKPSVAISVCSIIPLLPGKGMYDTMFFFIQNEAAYAADKALETIFTAGAIAVGIAMTASASRLISAAAGKIINR